MGIAATAVFTVLRFIHTAVAAILILRLAGAYIYQTAHAIMVVNGGAGGTQQIKHR